MAAIQGKFLLTQIYSLAMRKIPPENFPPSMAFLPGTLLEMNVFSASYVWPSACDKGDRRREDAPRIPLGD